MIKPNTFKRALILILAICLVILPNCAKPKDSYAKSGAYCVVDGSTGMVLYAQNEDERLPMASTTKVITAITAINNVEDLDKEYKIPKEAVGIEGSSVYLQEGEEVSIRELLYCLMLRSGNDSAVAIAYITAGGVENFAKLMNSTAKELGATSTNLTNPHGLHDENHYTTAKDLALISAKAMQNQTFREIVSAKKYVGKRTTYYNKNKLLSSLENADGVKTGYTKNAGRCLVSSATREGNRVVCVVLNCPDMYEASANLINKAYQEYNFVNVANTKEVFEVKINGVQKKTVKAAVFEDVIVPVKKGEEENLKVDVKLKDCVDFPITKGEAVGEICVFDKNKLLFSRKIATIETVGINEIIFG